MKALTILTLTTASLALMTPMAQADTALGVRGGTDLSIGAGTATHSEEVGTSTGINAGVNADVDAGAKADADAAAKAKSRMEAEAKADSDTKARMNSQAKADADVKTRTQSNASADADVDADADVRTQQSGLSTRSNTNARMKADVPAKAETNMNAGMAHQLSAFDENNDGVVTRSEFEAKTNADASANVFKDLDRDNNGKLNQAELDLLARFNNDASGGIRAAR